MKRLRVLIVLFFVGCGPFDPRGMYNVKVSRINQHLDNLQDRKDLDTYQMHSLYWQKVKEELPQYASVANQCAEIIKRIQNTALLLSESGENKIFNVSCKTWEEITISDDYKSKTLEAQVKFRQTWEENCFWDRNNFKDADSQAELNKSIEENRNNYFQCRDKFWEFTNQDIAIQQQEWQIQRDLEALAVALTPYNQIYLQQQLQQQQQQQQYYNNRPIQCTTTYNIRGVGVTNCY